MKPEIHLLDADERPTDGSIVSANCGIEVEFIPKYADFNGLRICPDCLEKHLVLRKVSTFALIK